MTRARMLLCLAAFALVMTAGTSRATGFPVTCTVQCEDGSTWYWDCSASLSICCHRMHVNGCGLSNFVSGDCSDGTTDLTC